MGKITNLIIEAEELGVPYQGRTVSEVVHEIEAVKYRARQLEETTVCEVCESHYRGHVLGLGRAS